MSLEKCWAYLTTPRKWALATRLHMTKVSQTIKCKLNWKKSFYVNIQTNLILQHLLYSLVKREETSWCRIQVQHASQPTILMEHFTNSGQRQTLSTKKSNNSSSLTSLQIVIKAWQYYFQTNLQTQFILLFRQLQIALLYKTEDC